MTATHMPAELARLAEGDGTGGAWRDWGPWLAERAWGTVREDYSDSGDAWSFLPFEESHRTAYRWNEDGLAGMCDDAQTLCVAFAFWNGVDPILKERLYGLTNSQGNHGEDGKEQHWYVDATPTASYLKWHYRYPQKPYPYEQLRNENAGRSKLVGEFELSDTGALDGCWAIDVEWAKAGPHDMVARVTVTNTGAEAATLHVLPTAWFRNTWRATGAPEPSISTDPGGVSARHHVLGTWQLSVDDMDAAWLFCDNDTDTRTRYGVPDGPLAPKDGIGRHVTTGAATVRTDGTGTKAAAWMRVTVAAGHSVRRTLRVTRGSTLGDATDVLAKREAEADAYYEGVTDGLDAERRNIARQAAAGLIWAHCFYHYAVRRWRDGDPDQPPPPPHHSTIRNTAWVHLLAHDVISMPDPWEYPWFASWDLCFQAVALAHVDPWRAKQQLLLLMQPWYQSPNGAVPAYEWEFSDVNPPVQAWAALEVFQIDGGRDLEFLERIFPKLCLQYTWWTNRLDPEGDDVYGGGFLGLDNVGPFNRTQTPAELGQLVQSDATAWSAMLCLDLMEMALTLAIARPAYEDVATTFVEHAASVIQAVGRHGLWDEQDGFLYDQLVAPDGVVTPLRVRSVVGLVGLAATRMVSDATLAALPAFAARLQWFTDHSPDGQCSQRVHNGRLVTVLPEAHLRRVLERVLDPAEFLSDHGLRSVSKYHEANPYHVPGHDLPALGYEPAEGRTGLFGGNSNWRGPVWFPLNLLVVTGLRRYAAAYGDQVTVPLPAPAGAQTPLWAVADDLAQRLIGLWLPGPDGRRPAQGAYDWPEGLMWFHEYYHGDTGMGLGADHQTGWTATVLDLLLRKP